MKFATASEFDRDMLTHLLLLSSSIRPFPFFRAAADDSFNGKFKQTSPSSSPHFPFLCSSFLCLHPSHLPKYHKAFSGLCFAVGDADRCGEKARQADGGGRGNGSNTDPDCCTPVLNHPSFWLCWFITSSLCWGQNKVLKRYFVQV